MVLVKMCHDNRLYLVGFYPKLRQQRRRFNKILSLSPFRGDVIRMIAGIDRDGSLGALDQPENIGDRFIPFEVTADARHDARTPPVFTHPDHQRVNGMIGCHKKSLIPGKANEGYASAHGAHILFSGFACCNRFSFTLTDSP